MVNMGEANWALPDEPRGGRHGLQAVVVLRLTDRRSGLDVDDTRRVDARLVHMHHGTVGRVGNLGLEVQARVEGRRVLVVVSHVEDGRERSEDGLRNRADGLGSGGSRVRKAQLRIAGGWLGVVGDDCVVAQSRVDVCVERLDANHGRGSGGKRSFFGRSAPGRIKEGLPAPRRPASSPGGSGRAAQGVLKADAAALSSKLDWRGRCHFFCGGAGSRDVSNSSPRRRNSTRQLRRPGDKTTLEGEREGEEEGGVEVKGIVLLGDSGTHMRLDIDAAVHL